VVLSGTGATGIAGAGLTTGVVVLPAGFLLNLTFSCIARKSF
jgi:hypothetical protein